MPVRATDRVTLASTLSVSYTRTYYLLQQSTLGAPAKPTTNPPASPWTTTEPGYTAGATVSLYTVTLTVYGSAGFEYGPVQLDSKYEASKQAYNASQAAAGAASTALETANGKNTVTYSSANASSTVPGKTNGDIWYRTSGNLITAMWVWNATASPAQWQTRTMDSTVLTNIDAGAIVTGSLRASVIGANTVGTDKLLVGSFTNLLEDPSFDVSPLTTAWAVTHANATRVSTNTRSGGGALRIKASNGAFDAIRQARALHVEPGEKYVYWAWVRTENTGSVINGIELSVVSGATDAGTTVASAVALSPAGLGATYVQIKGVWTVPAGHYFARPRIAIRNDVGNTNVYLVDDVFFQKQTDGDIIATGAVTASTLNVNDIWASNAWLDRMRAGTIEASMLTSGFGDTLNISGNSSIVLMAGQVADQSSAIAEQKSALNDVSSTVTDLTSTVGEAGSKADAAAVAAAAAQAAAAAAQATADTLNAYVRITGTGLEVGAPGAATAVKITPSSMSFNVNGVAGAYLDAGQFIAPRFVGEEVDLANIKIQKQGTRTVFKAI